MKMSSGFTYSPRREISVLINSARSFAEVVVVGFHLDPDGTKLGEIVYTQADSVLMKSSQT